MEDSRAPLGRRSAAEIGAHESQIGDSLQERFLACQFFADNFSVHTCGHTCGQEILTAGSPRYAGGTSVLHM